MIKKLPKFKVYNQQQALLLPPSLSELVPLGHPCRVVNDVIDKLDLTALVDDYELIGCSSNFNNIFG